VAGLSEPLEREVRLSLDVEHTWVEEDKPIKLLIRVDPILDPAAEEGVENE
jgi:hypothetical protein